MKTEKRKMGFLSSGGYILNVFYINFVIDLEQGNFSRFKISNNFYFSFQSSIKFLNLLYGNT